RSLKSSRARTPTSVPPARRKRRPCAAQAASFPHHPAEIHRFKWILPFSWLSSPSSGALFGTYKYRLMGGNMRGLIAVICTALLLAGCGSAPQEQRNALLGAAVGAGVGAAIGSATGNTLAGAAVGGVVGGVVGYLIRPEGCYFRNNRGEL